MKRSKGCSTISLVLFIALTLSGCWDSKDIEQKDIYLSLIIDYADENFAYYGEVANLSSSSQSTDKTANSKQSFDIITARDKTFVQARAEIERKSSGALYLGACKLLIFTNRMADKGLEEYLNRSRSQNDTRKSLKIITTATEPEELFKISPENSLSVGLTIDSIIERTTNEGSMFSVDIGNILEQLAVKKVGFLIPQFNVRGSKATLTGYTVFKDLKIAGLIPPDESKGVVYFLNPDAGFVYEVYHKDRKYVLKSQLKDKSIKTFYQNGQLSLDVFMNFSSELNYADKATILTKSDIRQLQTSLAEMIKQDILHAIDTSQNRYQTDYLGIYRYFRKNYNSNFKTLDWEQLYSEAKVKVETKVTILNSSLPQR